MRQFRKNIGDSPNSLGFDSVQSALKELSEPWRSGDRTKAMIDRASKTSGIPYWRVHDIWYGRSYVRLRADEYAKIQAALKRKRKVVAHNELAELRARMARLEALLASTDPDFHSEAIAALRNSTLRTD